MKKQLSEMTLEELWELFPIFLTEHKPYWDEWFCEESKRLHELLPSGKVTCISHIGSNAVNTIWAKPIIDILVEVTEPCKLQDIGTLLLKNGYVCMCSDEKRASFNKGYTSGGFAEKVFHLHLRYAGDNDELYFRDYLIDYPDVAKKYESIKFCLWKEYEHNWDAYTTGKTDFIEECMQKAKELYAGKYD